MSRRQIEDLLQECLTGYDHGLSPEECLAPFADRRDELEPLFRNALSLRFAYATQPDEKFTARARDKFMFAAGREVQTALSAEPSPEFKRHARDRFMFAAGREVTQALASEPSPEFQQDTRQKLIYAAGAAAQEALRNVSPPKLPFWVNARRNLLEAASRPQLKQPHKPVGFAFNAGLSMAGVMAAMVLAMGAYFYTQSAPTSVGAEYSYIEQQTIQVQNQVASGSTVSPAILADLTRRTNELAARLQEDPKADVNNKLAGLIDVQRGVLNQTATNSIKPPADAQQQLYVASQQLQQAESRVQQTQRDTAPTTPPSAPVQQAAAPGNTPTATAATATSVPPASPTPLKSTAPAIAPATATPAAVGPNQVRVRALPGDTALGIPWVEVRTAEARFVAPAAWTVAGLQLDSQGIATIGPGNSIGFAGPEVTMIVNLKTLQIDAVINGQSLPMPFPRVDLQVLFVLAGDKAPILQHVADSRQSSVPITASQTAAPAAPTATATTAAPTAVPATATPVPPTPTPVAVPTSKGVQ